MFSCCEDKDRGRISKTMNLEGHCPAVDIQDKGRKDGNALATERVSSDERLAKLRLSERSVQVGSDRTVGDKWSTVRRLTGS